jgi:hypothetical protein
MSYRIENLHPTAGLGPVIASLGFIPEWFDNAPAELPFKDIVSHFYVDVWHSWKQGTVNTLTGQYDYPGDPAMLPHARIFREAANEVIFAYPHAFFAVVTAGAGVLAEGLEWDMARLD